ncbi:MAG: LysR family transcriptional regulator [Oscillospiraceae bacterium]
MTISQLKYVLKTVRCGSISEAAKQLFISQPSLSAAIRELEAELGIEIFNRSARGISLSDDGAEFLGYARQVVEQTELLEQRYLNRRAPKRICAVSAQHYAFVVNAFVNLVRQSGAEEYEFTLRETRTHDIIHDVSTLRSEIGVLYLNDFNEKVLNRLLAEHHLLFTPLFAAKPHVFVSAFHPLADRTAITLADLEPYPCLSFEQGEYNSFYFSEEILSTVYHQKSLRVTDRATLFNLLIGLGGYTICSGILSTDLNGSDIVAVPLQTDERMTIGYITNRRAVLSPAAQSYIAELKKLIATYGYPMIEK